MFVVESFPHYRDNYRSAADGPLVSSASCEICTKVVHRFSSFHLLMRVVKQTIAHHRRLPFSADEYPIPFRCVESSAVVPSGPTSRSRVWFSFCVPSELPRVPCGLAGAPNPRRLDLAGTLHGGPNAICWPTDELRVKNRPLKERI